MLMPEDADLPAAGTQPVERDQIDHPAASTPSEVHCESDCFETNWRVRTVAVASGLCNTGFVPANE
jgi:hypothetical protein